MSRSFSARTMLTRRMMLSWPASSCARGQGAGKPPHARSGGRAGCGPASSRPAPLPVLARARGPAPARERARARAQAAAHLQVHDLAKRALRVGGVAEGVEALLQRHGLPRAAVQRLPNDAVRLARGGRARRGAREAVAGRGAARAPARGFAPRRRARTPLPSLEMMSYRFITCFSMSSVMALGAAAWARGAGRKGERERRGAPRDAHTRRARCCCRA